LSFTAQLGQAKIALALLLRVIFFKNHSRRVYFIFLPVLLLSLRYLLQAEYPKSSLYLKAVLFLLLMLVLTQVPLVFQIAPHLVTDLFGLSIVFGDISVAVTVVFILAILFRGVYPTARTLNARSAKTASRTRSCLAA
jgi:hypothetical protein